MVEKCILVGGKSDKAGFGIFDSGKIKRNLVVVDETVDADQDIAIARQLLYLQFGYIILIRKTPRTTKGPASLAGKVVLSTNLSYSASLEVTH